MIPLAVLLLMHVVRRPRRLDIRLAQDARHVLRHRSRIVKQ